MYKIFLNLLGLLGCDLTEKNPDYIDCSDDFLTIENGQSSFNVYSDANCKAKFTLHKSRSLCDFDFNFLDKKMSINCVKYSDNSCYVLQSNFAAERLDGSCIDEFDFYQIDKNYNYSDGLVYYLNF